MASLDTYILYFSLFFALLVGNISEVTSIQCKNERNGDVDWFVIYKLPKIVSSHNRLIKQGVAYLYMASDNYKNGWALSDKDIRSNDSMPGYTLAPFYDRQNIEKTLWLLYNDQAPNSDYVSYNGHTKGSVIVNNQNGFWLIHSVPHFPPQPNYGEDRQKVKKDKNTTESLLDKNDIPIGGYAYPTSGLTNGQSFLCISLDSTQFDTIGKQLKYNQIIVFKKNLPLNLREQYPILTEAASEKKIKIEPYNNKVQLQSLSGLKFISFAKSGKWNKDLYDDFVAPELNANLYTETWLNGRKKLPSDCNKTKVQNVEQIQLSSAEVEFKSTHDHSKWAVTVDNTQKRYVCIGDINRAETQFDRGGGTVCFNLLEVWKSYSQAVKEVEPCPKPKSTLNIVKSWFRGIISSF